MAGPLIRRQAERTWIHAGQQHVLTWLGFTAWKKMIVSSSNCSPYFFSCFSFQPSLPHTIFLFPSSRFFLLTSPLPHAPRLDCPHVSPFFLLWFVFPLLFYLVAFNSSFVQDLVITPGSVRLTAVRGLC